MTDITNTENNDLSVPFRGTGGETVAIYPLSEGSFTVDATKMFVPFSQDGDVLTERPTGSLLVEVQPFVVVTSKDVLLLDAGLGFTNPQTGKMQLHENLEKAGIKPEQVTKVLMTHLHKDHAGGICLEGDHTCLSLPNATYYIHKAELDFAMEKGLPSFIPDELQALQTSPQVQLLHDEEGTIDDYITYKHSGGHSPFHQVFWIKDGGRTIFFGGDESPQLQQMKVRYKARYDYNGQKAMELRQQWWEQGTKEGWHFLFYHDIKTPFFPAL